MPLIKCPDCKREISDKAASCPHCGCPVKDQPLPVQSSQSTADETAKIATKKLVHWYVWVILPPVLLLGYFIYCQTIKIHPAIKSCESVIIEHLKIPSTYKPLRREMVIIEKQGIQPSEASIYIEYEAANPYNARVKGDCQCIMGGLVTPSNDGKLYDFQMEDSLGGSPFNVLYIVKVILGDKEVEIPSSVLIHHVQPNIFTPPAPGFITDWTGDGLTDYVVRKTLDEKEIEKSREMFKLKRDVERQERIKAKQREEEVRQKAQERMQNPSQTQDSLTSGFLDPVNKEIISKRLFTSTFFGQGCNLDVPKLQNIIIAVSELQGLLEGWSNNGDYFEILAKLTSEELQQMTVSVENLLKGMLPREMSWYLQNLELSPEEVDLCPSAAELIAQVDTWLANK